MQIELTEQQARTLAQAARVGLRAYDLGIDEFQKPGPGDVAAAFVACDKLEQAVRVALGGGRE